MQLGRNGARLWRGCASASLASASRSASSSSGTGRALMMTCRSGCWPQLPCCTDSCCAQRHSTYACFVWLLLLKVVTAEDFCADLNTPDHLDSCSISMRRKVKHCTVSQHETCHDLGLFWQTKAPACSAGKRALSCCILKGFTIHASTYISLLCFVHLQVKHVSRSCALRNISLSMYLPHGELTSIIIIATTTVLLWL